MVLRIKEVLAEKGMSVIDLAEKLDVTRGACYSYLNGNPTVEVLEKIAAAIGVHVTDLFDKPKSNGHDAHKVEFYVSIDGNMYKIEKEEIIKHYINR